MTASQTFKLTPAQVRLFLNPSNKAHHMTVKALTRLNLLDADGWFTDAGKTVQNVLLGRLAEVKGVDRDAAVEVVASYPKLRTVEVSNATRPVSVLSMSEWVQAKDAVRQVANDQRQSFPMMSDLEAVDRAQDTLALPGRGCVGAQEIDLDGSALSEAYRLVLTYPKATRQIAESNALPR